MILMIDNYDSFTYNIVQYCLELGADLKIIRNDELSIEEIKAEIEILKELAVQYKFDLNFNEANFLQDEYITERMKNLLKFHE